MTYQEYREQPDWFIDILNTIEKVDSQEAARRRQKAKDEARRINNKR